MKIVHISDLHFWSFSFKLDGIKSLIASLHHLFFRSIYLGTPPVKEFLKRQKSDRPDLIVITGDISSVGFYKEYKKANEVLLTPLKEMGIPYVSILGNHDVICNSGRKEFFQHIKDNVSYENIFNLSLEKDRIIVYKYNSYFFIGLEDSIQRPIGVTKGYLDPSSLKMLENALSVIQNECKSPHVILYTHYPLHKSNEHDAADNSHLLKNILDKYDGFVIHLHGHTHSYAIEKPSNNIVSVDSSSLTHGKEGAYSMLTITDKNIQIQKYKQHNSTKEWEGEEYMEITNPMASSKN